VSEQGSSGRCSPSSSRNVTHGTGRFNVSLGAVTAATGIGAAVSNYVAGSIVVAAGYHTAFLALGAIAGGGFALYMIAMPETGPRTGSGARPDAATPVT